MEFWSVLMSSRLKGWIRMWNWKAVIMTNDILNLIFMAHILSAERTVWRRARKSEKDDEPCILWLSRFSSSRHWMPSYLLNLPCRSNSLEGGWNRLWGSSRETPAEGSEDGRNGQMDWCLRTGNVCRVKTPMAYSASTAASCTNGKALAYPRYGEILKIHFKFESTPFCKNYFVINSYHSISSFSPNFRILGCVPVQKCLQNRCIIGWWLCFWPNLWNTHFWIRHPVLRMYPIFFKLWVWIGNMYRLRGKFIL